MTAQSGWPAFKEAAPESRGEGRGAFRRDWCHPSRHDPSRRLAPEEPKFHVFEIADIKSAALFFNEEMTRKVKRFRRGGEGVEEITQTV